MLAKLKSLLVKDWIQTSYSKGSAARREFYFGLWQRTKRTKFLKIFSLSLNDIVLKNVATAPEASILCQLYNLELCK